MSYGPALVTPAQQRVAVAVAAFTVAVAGSFTTLSGLLTAELSAALGWSATTTTIGVAVNMVLYGATAPFALHAMARFGIHRITIAALGLVSAGSLACTVAEPAVFNLAWGFAVGAGCGALTLAYGAFIARLWFARPGTATGTLTAAAVTGQFALLPFWAWTSSVYGWRVVLIGSAALSGLAIAANLVFLGPRFAGLAAISRRYGRPDARLGDLLSSLKDALGRPVFWVIAAHFALCGATTNGLMWSLFTPAATPNSLDAASASIVLLLIGVFNIPGTIISGWLTDRLRARDLLAVVFVCRAATLLWLPVILGPGLDWRLLVFGVLFGLFDVATVPPVIGLCNRVFDERGPVIFGWVNVFHQLGAGAMTVAGGAIHRLSGMFWPLWLLAAGACLSAAGLVYASRYRPIAHDRRAAPATP